MVNNTHWNTSGTGSVGNGFSYSMMYHYPGGDWLILFYFKNIYFPNESNQISFILLHLLETEAFGTFFKFLKTTSNNDTKFVFDWRSIKSLRFFITKNYS